MNSVNTQYSLGKIMFVLQMLQNIAILGKLNIVHSFQISWLVCCCSFTHIKACQSEKAEYKEDKRNTDFLLKRNILFKKFIDKLTKFWYYSIFNIKCGFILLEFNACIQSILIISTPYSFHAILPIPPNIVLYQS